MKSLKLDAQPSISQLNVMTYDYYLTRQIPCYAHVRFVQQQTVMDYDTQIYQRHEVPTRIPSYHDLFNAISWLAFAKSKLALNQLSVQSSRVSPLHVKQNRRTPIQNKICLFDECGAIILTTDQKLIDAIKHHQWEYLFWDARDDLKHSLDIQIFGHGIFEKFLTPYIGLTVNAYCMKVEEEILNFPIEKRRDWLDSQLSQDILKRKENCYLTELTPFPVLGLPGYWDNNFKAFYQNKRYFR